MKCNHLEELLKEQKKVLTRHLDKHKWLNSIEDKQKAITDFNEKYGWLMREVFCDNCSENESCEAYQEYLAKKYNETSHLNINHFGE